jgi:DNA-binding transcriptional regulator YiaG
MIDKANIAHALKTFRCKNDLALDQMAHRIGVSISTVQKWESGTHVPQDRQFYKLIHAYPGILSIRDARQSAATDCRTESC